MTSSTVEQHDMEQLRSLFSGLRLNASQAARVAGVKRPVIATWASRHGGTGFPRAVEQSLASRETLYDAFDFAVWASSRLRAKRTFEEMLVQAAVEGSVAPALEKNVALRHLIQSLMTLVLVFRVVDPTPGERPVALLRRYAAASPDMVGNLEPFILKVTPADLALLLCPAYALARFSDDVLGGVQLFSSLVMGRQKLGEQISDDLGGFLRSISARFSGDVRLHFASGTDSALMVQVAQTTALTQDARRGLQLTSAGVAGDSDFAKVLGFLADEELLLVPESGRRAWEPALIVVVLPLAKSAVDDVQQWSDIEDLLFDAPLGVPVVVLGRAEVLGSAFVAGDNSPRQSVLEAGHLLALVSCGQKQLVTESGARLMLGVFENRRRSGSEKNPLVALINLSEKLDVFYREAQEQALHDIESLAYESRQAVVYSSSGEHRMVSGLRVPWPDVKELGFDGAVELSSRVSSIPDAVSGIERDVERVNSAVYPSFSLDWRVDSVSGSSTRTLGGAREDGQLRRVAGMTAQKLAELAVGSSGEGTVRVVDVEAMEHYRQVGVLPAEYDALSAMDVLNLEIARDGDLLVCEGPQPAVFAVRGGLMVAKSPVFIVRRNLPGRVQPDFRLEVFAGLVQAALDAQARDGSSKVSWQRARISGELLNAVLSDVSNEQVDRLDQQLKKVREQKLFLREQLLALESLEKDTLGGLAEGSIRFS
ncbi:hypothetical protein [Rothia nasisuis]|uniref:hypothetical protein n=1 Tax=Rothia nasisuis TaxID=2109647 RepID=UPI001F1E8A45|nr:hypothetical protein [Rothia nasisuis]